jgi:ribose transport system substrate-binding protein
LPVIAGCSVLTTANQERPEIYAFIHSTDSEYWQQAAWGLEAAARDKQASVEINEINLTDDYDNSVKLIRKAVRKTTKAILITPDEGKELHKQLEKAYKRGISLLYLDAEKPYDIPGTYVYSDNEKAAEKAGQLLAESLQGKGKVVMLNIASDNPKANEREMGFRKAIQEYSEIELVNIFDCSSSREITEKTIADILVAHPDIQGIFAACPETSLGTVSALTALSKENGIKVVGFDHTTETMNYVNDRQIYAYVGQNSYQIGYKAIETALDILSGKAVPEKIDAGYDVSDIADPAVSINTSDAQETDEGLDETEETAPQN